MIYKKELKHTQRIFLILLYTYHCILNSQHINIFIMLRNIINLYQTSI